MEEVAWVASCCYFTSVEPTREILRLGSVVIGVSELVGSLFNIVREILAFLFGGLENW
jgi:hypothetical protein